MGLMMSPHAHCYLDFFGAKLFSWAPYKSSHPFYLPLPPSISP
jgi:hypothetical protein